MTSTTLARPVLQMGALSDPAELGRLLAASGYFADAKDAAQAVVKVLAGQELGFGPIASMTGIYIVKGRVTLSANLMAATIKRHPRYDYRVIELTDEQAAVRFLQDGEEAGTSQFTMQDAERAGLLDGENWRKYPRNMLLWRALSNGAKWFCPDAFAGAPIYSPDELGADMDPETGELVIEAGQPTRPAPPVSEVRDDPQPAPEPQPAPASPAAGAAAAGELVSAEQAEQLSLLLDEHEVPAATRRMALLGLGKQSLAELTVEEAGAMRDHVLARYGS
jgi:hypothetical protein